MYPMLPYPNPITKHKFPSCHPCLFCCCLGSFYVCCISCAICRTKYFFEEHKFLNVVSVASDTTDSEPVTKGYTTGIDAATGFKI